ncbi:hypothetical protein [Paenibacillus sp. FSL E2-0177]|uniref:hypothetical protein n=1 Tax=Paenibacillus sp. FSL E2-0177 TaxID=2921360 RepID=UPI0030ED54B9
MLKPAEQRFSSNGDRCSAVCGYSRLGASASQLISVGQGEGCKLVSVGQERIDVGWFQQVRGERCKLISAGQDRIDVSWSQQQERIDVSWSQQVAGKHMLCDLQRH